MWFIQDHLMETPVCTCSVLHDRIILHSGCVRQDKRILKVTHSPRLSLGDLPLCYSWLRILLPPFSDFCSSTLDKPERIGYADCRVRCRSFANDARFFASSWGTLSERPYEAKHRQITALTAKGLNAAVCLVQIPRGVSRRPTYRE